jgi:hypothetical protein
MTLLVSWVGVDTHGISSAYIATDSRITWGNDVLFDYGRKVFAFQNSPDILGYCGDVLFPTMVLSQIADMANHGLLFHEEASCKERFEIITEKLILQFKEYPKLVEHITAPSLQVIHISRDLKDNKIFECRLIQWSRKSGWSGKKIPLPSISNIVISLGSGAKEFSDNYERYEASHYSGTSRSVFHCFCDTLINTKNKQCGGAPQLIGIYRKPLSHSITYGIINNRKRFFLGMPITKGIDFSKIEWRNDLFELCDGRTMKRLDQAQPQPDPARRR